MLLQGRKAEVAVATTVAKARPQWQMAINSTQPIAFRQRWRWWWRAHRAAVIVSRAVVGTLLHVQLAGTMGRAAVAVGATTPKASAASRLTWQCTKLFTKAKEAMEEARTQP